MDSIESNSLEVIANLLYLIRHSFHDRTAAFTYIDLAEERLIALGSHTALTRSCPE